ncbi:tail protein [Streptococcus phage Javan173]|uniref:phage major tail protein, TP901-1 family n=1 Tax=Streptococcus entericus TaxID=155680 RepID=UPI000369ED2E|nr:phage major tail protein, TP901-1 family [Streptococcus entericus]QBX15140.1 tail protein [Streptococcus phage Javan173]
MEVTEQIKVTTAKPLSGKKVFYFIQSIHAKLGSNAILPAYRTDGGLTLGAEYSDEQTQQGLLLDKTNTAHEIELTTKFAPADPSVAVIEKANDTGESVKIWRVLVDESLKKKGKGNLSQKDVYPAKFGYAKIGDIEYSEGIEDIVEANYTASIVGKLQNGEFPLSDEEIALLNDVYEYQNPGETTGDYDNIKKSED